MDQVKTTDASYPLTISTVPWGIKGTAYNLNEFLNTGLPVNKEDDTTMTTALISPGASTRVSADGLDGIKMQPVGRFRVKTGAEDENPRDVYVGRVVKIDVISSKMLDVLNFGLSSPPCSAPNTEERGPIYVFDVENSGTCVTTTPA